MYGCGMAGLTCLIVVVRVGVLVVFFALVATGTGQNSEPGSLKCSVPPERTFETTILLPTGVSLTGRRHGSNGGSVCVPTAYYGMTRQVAM